MKAETYPPRHQLHKYWGKKPANVVQALVERYTAPGQTVLDPFSGAGVTAIEARRVGRSAVAFDTNPIAVRLGSLILDPPDADSVARAGRAIVASVDPIAGGVYRARCAACGELGTARAFVWEKSELVAIRGACAACGARLDRDANAEDRKLARSKIELLEHPDAPLPRAWQMRKLHRAGLVRLSELFTSRNRLVLAHLLSAIHEVGNAPIREALLLTFTANLAQATLMIADFSGRAGGPSWKINCYWLPKRWQELNVLSYFENRLAKTVHALKDAQHTSVTRASIRRGDARALDLPSGSIDYVFADPPYGGEGIQYAELSFMWNVWLGEEQAFDEEIAFNPGRGRDLPAYGDDLCAAFAECRRVLRPKAFMTVAFANKERAVWETLTAAIARAGLRVESETSIARSAPGLTQRVAARSTQADVLVHVRAGRRA